jgi:RNA polymerase-associated protein CTR9
VLKRVQACIAYNKKNYEEAFGYYRKVLELNPASPGAVRLGLAFCHYRLNRLELARKAFERVLVLEPDNVPALAALAVLELNTAKPKAVHRAMSLLKQAYDADPTSSFVLNHLANHFFYKKEYKKTIHLAQAAFNNTTVREIKAESFYHFGRAYHAQEDFEKASACYYQYTPLPPS